MLEKILPKHNNKKNSIIFGVLTFIASLSLYMFLISPFVEISINNALVSSSVNNSIQRLNHLTPIGTVYAYSSEYSIGSVSQGSSLGDVETTNKIFTEDPRVVAMNKFLLDYHSPMAPWSESFITEADKYGLDWRLVASISGVESAFGNLIPRGTNNGWGWRGINGNEAGWSVFSNWGAGIAEVTRGLAQGYGVTLTPFQIEPSYCPPCGANPAHVWANGVTRYMSELDYYLDNLENN